MTVASTFNASAPSRVAEANGAPWLVAVAFGCLLTPIYFLVGDILLDPGRVFFAFLTPWLLIQLFSGRLPGGILLVDKFVLGFCAWLTIAMLVNHPIQFSLVNVTLHLIYILGGYLCARYAIRSFSDFRALVLFMVCLVLFFTPFAIYESLTTEFVIPYWLSSLGFGTITDTNNCCRFGLDRAQVVFSHPIHFGFFCSFMVGAFFVSFHGKVPFMGRVLICLVMTVACVMSVSSGPLLSIMFQGAVILYWLITNKMKRPWINLLRLAGVSYVILELASNRPAIYAIAERLAFSPGTAFNRLLIFQYGMEQFWRTPILGIGYRRIPTMPAWMKDSADNYWLVVAVAYGFPAFVAFAGVFFLIYRQVGRNFFDRNTEWFRANLAVAVMLTGLVLVLATVAVWLDTLSMTFTLLGAAGFLFHAQPNRAVAEAPKAFARRTVFGDMWADAAERAAGGPKSEGSVSPTQTKPGRRTVL